MGGRLAPVQGCGGRGWRGATGAAAGLAGGGAVRVAPPRPRGEGGEVAGGISVYVCLKKYDAINYV